MRKEDLVSHLEKRALDSGDLGAMFVAGPGGLVGKMERDEGDSWKETAGIGALLGGGAAATGIMFGQNSISALRKALRSLRPNSTSKLLGSNKALSALILAGGATGGVAHGLLGRLFSKGKKGTGNSVDTVKTSGKTRGVPDGTGPVGRGTGSGLGIAVAKRDSGADLTEEEKRLLYNSRGKTAGAFRDLVTLGVPTAIGAAIGKNISKDISFDDKVEVQMKAHPRMSRNKAIDVVYRREELPTPDSKAKKIKQFATISTGGFLGLLAALKGRRLIR